MSDFGLVVVYYCVVFGKFVKVNLIMFVVISNIKVVMYLVFFIYLLINVGFFDQVDKVLFKNIGVNMVKYIFWVGMFDNNVVDICFMQQLFQQ